MGSLSSVQEALLSELSREFCHSTVGHVDAVISRMGQSDTPVARRAVSEIIRRMVIEVNLFLDSEATETFIDIAKTDIEVFGFVDLIVSVTTQKYQPSEYFQRMQSKDIFLRYAAIIAAYGYSIITKLTAAGISDYIRRQKNN